MDKRWVERIETSIFNYGFMKMGGNLDDAILFDKHKIWKTKNEQSPVELFIRQNYNALGIKSPNYQSYKREIALNNVLCNLINSHERQKPLAISRDKSFYANNSFYGMTHYTYSFILDSMDKLKEYDYVELKGGFYDRETGRGKRTRCIVKEKLIYELQDYFNLSGSLNCKHTNLDKYLLAPPASIYFKRLEYTNPIILKNAEKIKITYQPTSEIKKMKNFLLEYNELIKRFKITIKNKDLNTFTNYNYTLSNNISSSNTQYSFCPLLSQDNSNYLYHKELDCRLHRVFNNGKFDEGGRFYGAEYQRLSEVERSQISINEKSVIEIDFFCLHGRMIYHIYKNMDYLEDAYLIENNREIRTAAKKMFQMMLNAKGRLTSIGAFKKFLREDTEGVSIEESLGKNNLTPSELYKALERKHIMLRDYFSTGIGLKLQFIDSQIAEAILKYFTLKGIPCLCIHDSFIVEKKYADELAAVMKRKYKEIVGFEGMLKNY